MVHACLSAVENDVAVEIQRAVHFQCELIRFAESGPTQVGEQPPLPDQTIDDYGRGSELSTLCSRPDQQIVHVSRELRGRASVCIDQVTQLAGQPEWVAADCLRVS